MLIIEVSDISNNFDNSDVLRLPWAVSLRFSNIWARFIVRAGYTPFEIIDLSFLTSLIERAIVYFCFGIIVSNSLIFNYKDTKNI